jgi:hypothetical protein
MSDQRFCEHCGAPLSVALRFCEQCGKPVLLQTPPARAPSGATGLPEHAALRVAARPRRKLATIAMLLLAAIAGAWWLLGGPAERRVMPNAAPLRVDPVPETPPTLPMPEAVGELPGVVQAELDPQLAAAQRRRDAVFSNYTRIAVGEIPGDIDAAREQYRIALEELEAAERAAGRSAR